MMPSSGRDTSHAQRLGERVRLYPSNAQHWEVSAPRQNSTFQSLAQSSTM
jgi:hypothetical protein